MDELPPICVVSQPIGETGDTAQRTLIDVLSALTSVVLVASDVPADAPLRRTNEVVSIGGPRPGEGVLGAAVGFILDQVLMCVTIARRDEPVVLFFGTTAYLLPILWARLLGRTVVLEPRGDVPGRLCASWSERLPAGIAAILAWPVALLERIGYRTADAIVTYTPSMAVELGLDRYGHKLYTNGARYVDTEAFDVTVPFEDRNDVVGYVGRLESGKGVRKLAAAARSMPADLTVRFIGGGPLGQWIRSSTGGGSDGATVELRGWVDHKDVPAELNELRILVLPSESEGLPTIVLEAMACGTPVYATSVSGVPDVVRDGTTGFLMDGPEASEMATAIPDILARDDLDEISRASRALIEEEYDFRAAVDRYREILEGISRASSGS